MITDACEHPLSFSLNTDLCSCPGRSQSTERGWDGGHGRLRREGKSRLEKRNQKKETQESKWEMKEQRKRGSGGQGHKDPQVVGGTPGPVPLWGSRLGTAGSAWGVRWRVKQVPRSRAGSGSGAGRGARDAHASLWMDAPKPHRRHPPGPEGVSHWLSPLSLQRPPGLQKLPPPLPACFPSSRRTMEKSRWAAWAVQIS